LDNYFSDAENDTLTYGYSGPSNINVTINPTTHVVSFSQPENFTGIEYVVFSANDGNSTTYSNNVTLVVYSTNATIVVVNNVTNVTNVTVVQGGGGGGKTRYVYIPVNVSVNVTEPACREIWFCTEWSECHAEGFMNRSCEDINNCGETFFMPDTEKECKSTLPFEEAPIEKPVCMPCYIIPAILVILLIILVILILTENNNKKQNKRC
jgi:hypothetical protein